MARFTKGTKVTWKWGQGCAEGEVKDIFTSRITKHIKDESITRNASEHNPAYVIEQNDGDRVLKLDSELD